MLNNYRYVIANDLSSSATEIMRRNVQFNDLGPQVSTLAEQDEGRETASIEPLPKPHLGKVRINEGDAWLVSTRADPLLLIHRSSALMYSYRAERQRVDVVDLDPYGTAAPFIDAAVQCVSDGGK